METTTEALRSVDTAEKILDLTSEIASLMKELPVMDRLFLLAKLRDHFTQVYAMLNKDINLQIGKQVAGDFTDV